MQAEIRSVASVPPPLSEERRAKRKIYDREWWAKNSERMKKPFAALFLLALLASRGAGAFPCVGTLNPTCPPGTVKVITGAYCDCRITSAPPTPTPTWSPTWTPTPVVTAPPAPTMTATIAPTLSPTPPGGTPRRYTLTLACDPPAPSCTPITLVIVTSQGASVTMRPAE